MWTGEIDTKKIKPGQVVTWSTYSMYRKNLTHIGVILHVREKSVNVAEGALSIEEAMNNAGDCNFRELEMNQISHPNVMMKKRLRI